MAGSVSPISSYEFCAPQRPSKAQATRGRQERSQGCCNGSSRQQTRGKQTIMTVCVMGSRIGLELHGKSVGLGCVRRWGVNRKKMRRAKAFGGLEGTESWKDEPTPFSWSCWSCCAGLGCVVVCNVCGTGNRENANGVAGTVASAAAPTGQTRLCPRNLISLLLRYPCLSVPGLRSGSVTPPSLGHNHYTCMMYPSTGPKPTQRCFWSSPSAYLMAGLDSSLLEYNSPEEP